MLASAYLLFPPVESLRRSHVLLAVPMPMQELSRRALDCTNAANCAAHGAPQVVRHAAVSFKRVQVARTEP